MINRDEMLPLLLEACPSFAPIWDEFLAEWKVESELPYYLALADLARHLVAKLAASETAEFGAVFEIVERLHVEGDPYVKNAATVGLLEDLHNSGIHTTTEPEDFRKYLLPQSERWWDKLYAFWNEGKLLSED